MTAKTALTAKASIRQSANAAKHDESPACPTSCAQKHYRDDRNSPNSPAKNGALMLCEVYTIRKDQVVSLVNKHCEPCPWWQT